MVSDLCLFGNGNDETFLFLHIPPYFTDIDSESLVSVKAVPIQTIGIKHHIDDKRRSAGRTVKRTASMPSYVKQPGTDPHYAAVEKGQLAGRHQVIDTTPTGPSERPGRGVFSSTGRKIHEGQRQGEDRPPRLPARNTSPSKYGDRSASTDRAVLPDNKDWSKAANTNTRFNNPSARHYIDHSSQPHPSSDSSSKPIDHLRNRVRLQQEKEQQEYLASKTSRKVPVLNQHNHSTNEQSEYGFHKNVPLQDSQAIGHSRQSRTRSRNSRHHETPMEWMSKNSSQQQQTVPFASRAFSPQRPKDLQQKDHPHAMIQTKTISPERHRTPLGSQLSQPMQPQRSQQVPYITRTVSPDRSKNVRSTTANQQPFSIPPEHVQRYPQMRDSTPENVAQMNAGLSTNRKAMTAMDYSDHPKPAASNKYKMLVCPDFFPVAKLNGLPRRKSRVDEEFFADDALETDTGPPAEHLAGKELGSFYKQKTSQMKPVQTVVQMDDSFVEDPREQLLYPSNQSAPRTKSQTKDSADFYFEVSPTKAIDVAAVQSNISEQDRGVFTTVQCRSPQAAEGDSIFSIHSLQQPPESGTSLQSTHPSEGKNR